MDDDTAGGRVAAVHVAPEAGAPVTARDRVEAVAGRGLRGDRYFDDAGTFSAPDADRDVTFVEGETLEAAARDYGVAVGPDDHRRNVTTRGVALNRLVGRRFGVGEATFEGVERCEPCSYLERALAEKGVREPTVPRGGIRARVVEDGVFAPGDAVTDLGPAPEGAG
jgi:MOSC domain-containing protein YiiM